MESLTSPEIAERPYVSKSTVKFHVSSILNKLQVSCRTEAAAKALQEGLIDQSQGLTVNGGLTR